MTGEADDFHVLDESRHMLPWVGLGDDPFPTLRARFEGVLRKQDPGSVLEWVRLVGPADFLTGGPETADGSHMVVRRAGVAVRFELSVRDGAGRAWPLQGVVSLVGTNLDRPGETPSFQFHFDLDADLATMGSKGRLLERVYDLDPRLGPRPPVRRAAPPFERRPWVGRGLGLALAVLFLAAPWTTVQSSFWPDRSVTGARSLVALVRDMRASTGLEPAWLELAATVLVPVAALALIARRSASTVSASAALAGLGAASTLALRATLGADPFQRDASPGLVALASAPLGVVLAATVGLARRERWGAWLQRALSVAGAGLAFVPDGPPRPQDFDWPRLGLGFRTALVFLAVAAWWEVLEAFRERVNPPEASSSPPRTPPG